MDKFTYDEDQDRIYRKEKGELKQLLDGHEICKILNSIDDDMIEFGQWLEELKPNDRVSVWSKSGEHRGMFNMDHEQLLQKYKDWKRKR